MSELQSLPLFHQIAGTAVLVLGDGDAAEPKRRLVQRAGGIVVDDERRAIDEGVRIAFVAFEDAKACEVAAINLRCAGMLVNVVDRPDLCDFTTPSILDRNPVLIAIGTGGASAGLAKHIRLRLERILPPSLGLLAQALFAARPKLRKLYPAGADRRRALDDALRERGPLDALSPASHERIADWLDMGTPAPTDDTILFNLQSADPEELTVKQARLLGEADVLCVPNNIPPDFLARARADAVRLKCDRQTCLNAKDPLAPREPLKCSKAIGAGHRSGLTVILRWSHAD